MTPKKFFDWQTAGGTDDVMRLISCLEQADIRWCAIADLAVNHWAKSQMVTQDANIVVTADSIDHAISAIKVAGFTAEEFQWSVNFRGRSKVIIQLSKDEFYLDFPDRSVPADIHGILMRVSSLEDTLQSKIRAWKAPERRQSKKIKDLADIARLIESHPHLWDTLEPELKAIIEEPQDSQH